MSADKDNATGDEEEEMPAVTEPMEENTLNTAEEKARSLSILKTMFGGSNDTTISGTASAVPLDTATNSISNIQR